MEAVWVRGGACGAARSTSYGHAFVLVMAVMLLAGNLYAKDYFVYFGTFTNAMSKGIYVSRLDADTGKLSEPELAAETASPCYLAISKDQKFLYADNNFAQFNGEKAGAVSAFTIDSGSGHLTLLNQKSAGGPGPCHVSVDAESKVLLIANYAGGSVKSFRLNSDGSIGADGSFILHRGYGPNTNRQTMPHAHFIHPDPSNRFALVCDLGTDKVIVYEIHPETGRLTEKSVAKVPPGAGARHLAFSPDGKFVHVLNEMGCTVTTFAWNAGTGEMTPVETVSVLPKGVTADPGFTAAEILTLGNHVYATVRGHDSVTVFDADPQTGKLELVQNVPSGGQVPRGLGIDPTGRWLIAGHQKSNNAVEFEIDKQTGKITPTGRELKMGSPVDVEFAAPN